MTAFVYILKSDTGRYYIGSTNDRNRRMRQHKSGHTHSTKRLGVLTLAFLQEYPSIEDARKIERKIKKLKRKDYVEKIIKEGYIRITY